LRNWKEEGNGSLGTIFFGWEVSTGRTKGRIPSRIKGTSEEGGGEEEKKVKKKRKNESQVSGKTSSISSVSTQKECKNLYVFV